MRPFDFHFPARLVGGPGAAKGIGRLVRDLGGTRVLLLADNAWTAGGVTRRISTILERDGFAIVTDGRDTSGNIVVTIGAQRPPRAAAAGWPVIAIPCLTDSGAPATTGDAVHRTEPSRRDIVVLDAELSMGVPRDVIACAMLDATTHAIEAWVSTRRTVMSDLCAREAWRQLASSVPTLLNAPDDLESMSVALLGSFLANTAAEHSTLGAAHACAGPVSRRYGVPHGAALALLLPEVVRWNSRVVGDRYAELAAVRGEARRPETLLARLEDLVSVAGFPERLAATGVVERELPAMAHEASTDTAGAYNPRKFDAAGALEIYAAAY